MPRELSQQRPRQFFDALVALGVASPMAAIERQAGRNKGELKNAPEILRHAGLIDSTTGKVPLHSLTGLGTAVAGQLAASGRPPS